jgi:LacI family transcriptional regulator
VGRKDPETVVFYHDASAWAMLPRFLSYCAERDVHVVPAPLALRKEFPLGLGRRLEDNEVRGAIWTASEPGAVDWIIDQAERSGKPLVRLMRCRSDPRWGSVDTDHAAMGRMGARHLMEQGFGRFAFVALDVPWCLQRMNGFREALSHAGHKCETNVFDPGEETGGVHNRLLQWLDDLPRPVAIMAGIDRTAEIIQTACRELSLIVPAEVAILGADNEVSQYSRRSISTVACHYEGIANTALNMLDDMLAGRCEPGRVTLVAPERVVQRFSTERLMEADELVARALRYLQSQPPDKLSLEDLYAHLAASPRTVRRHFAKALGFPPQHEIQRLRMRAAKRMLRTTDMSLSEIAQRCGYDYMSNMCHAFKTVFGITPTEYRKRADENPPRVRESH